MRYLLLLLMLLAGGCVSTLNANACKYACGIQGVEKVSQRECVCRRD